MKLKISTLLKYLAILIIPAIVFEISIQEFNIIKYEYNYLKKVTVSDTTTFFNPDKTPRIWYYKSGNSKLEFFTYRGEHPEVSGK